MNEKHYELRILPLFADDLNEIVDYITYRLRNPVAAEAFLDETDLNTGTAPSAVPPPYVPRPRPGQSVAPY